MKQLAYHLSALFVHLGGFGLLFLGVLDSSFLFMPLGNDLLVIAMTARHHSRMPYYALMASAGSTLGCLLIDIVFRKGGEAGLERHVPRKRLNYVRKKVKRNAAWALGFACLMPPPFPFTPFVAAAAALEYPRKKLLTVVACFRMLRFSTEGVLAVVVGARILRIAESPAVIDAIVALIVISIGGSAVSIWGWIRRSRKVEKRAA